MTTGMTVHNTSTNVLCVVRDGVGWDLALNFTITITSSARTNIVMAVINHNTEVGSQNTSPCNGMGGTSQPNFQGRGCPPTPTTLPPRRTRRPPQAPNPA